MNKVKRQQIVNFVCIVIACALMFISGYNSHKWNLDYAEDCKMCITSECLDYDLTCGDFGHYYWKLFFFTALLPCLAMGFLLPFIGMEEKAKK